MRSFNDVERNEPVSQQTCNTFIQNNFNLDLTSAQCINQGLEEKQLCVYASVNGFDKSHLLNISSQIMDYEENIRKKRNLLVVDLKPYYERCLGRRPDPFQGTNCNCDRN